MRLGWLREAPAASRKALLAASLGWMLDSFDVMLYALVLASLIAEFHMSKATAGVLGSITLVAAALGGMAFGVVADRFGRTRALMASVLIYAVFTAACGLAHSVLQLAVFRVLLGFGMGGEWASGASLVSESFPGEVRGKALGLMQSAWAVGYALAALVVWAVLPRYGWRAVFFVGILPAFMTLWIRRNVEEPEAWRAVKSEQTGRGFKALFASPLLVLTLGLTAMNACCLFAWWGFNLWVPAYLSLAPGKGGIGLPGGRMTAIVVFMQVGMWLGYVTFGYLSDRFGRVRTYAAYLAAASVLMLAFGGTRAPWVLFGLAPFVAFAATGYFSGFAALTAEVYSSRIRATAQGFTYNTGRITSAAAPFLVGSFADRHGFRSAFVIAAGAFALAALLIGALAKRLAAAVPAS